MTQHFHVLISFSKGNDIVRESRLFPVSPNVVPSFSSHNIFSPNCQNIVASSVSAFQTSAWQQDMTYVFFLMTERTQCKYVARSSLIATLALLTIASPMAIEIWANNKKSAQFHFHSKRPGNYSVWKNPKPFIHKKLYERPKEVCSLPVSIHGHGIVLNKTQVNYGFVFYRKSWSHQVGETISPKSWSLDQL